MLVNHAYDRIRFATTKVNSAFAVEAQLFANILTNYVRLWRLGGFGSG